MFAGAGGFSLGFNLAGYDVPLAVEIDKWAADTLRANHNESEILERDIRDIRSESAIRDIYSGTVDVIVGGPPCQGFSVAGPANKDPKDPRNSLFMEFANWVKVLDPKVFVMENVKGLLTRRNTDKEKVINIIAQSFEELGYHVDIWLLNAANYGVPQNRERIFIVGNKIGQELHSPAITHGNQFKHEQSSFFEIVDDLFPPLTLWEAISDLPSLSAGEGDEVQEYIALPENDYQASMRDDSELLFNHVAMKHTKRMVERFKHIKWGESGADVPDIHKPRKRNGNGEISITVYDQNNRRLHPYKPSHTIPASFYANFVHPFQDRNLTAREGARIQSFPDNYKFMGKKTLPSKKLLIREGREDEDHLSQYNQIGNAVPPLLAKQIAMHIKREIFKNVSTRR